MSEPVLGCEGNCPGCSGGHGDSKLKQVFRGELSGVEGRNVLVDELISAYPNYDELLSASDVLGYFINGTSGEEFQLDGDTYVAIPGTQMAICKRVAGFSESTFGYSRVTRLCYLEEGFVVGYVYLMSRNEFSSWGVEEWGIKDTEIVYPHADTKVTFSILKENSVSDVAWSYLKDGGCIREMDPEDFEFIARPKYRDQALANELKSIGMTQDSDEPMNALMWEQIMRIADLVSLQGHSGYSFSYLSGIMQKYFSSEPILAPLTGEEWEWNDMSQYSGNPHWQNKRLSSVFKELDENGEPHYYWLDGTIFYTTHVDKETGEKYKHYFTNSDSRLEIKSFPWMPPEKQYVEVHEDA